LQQPLECEEYDEKVNCNVHGWLVSGSQKQEGN